MIEPPCQDCERLRADLAEARRHAEGVVAALQERNAEVERLTRQVANLQPVSPSVALNNIAKALGEPLLCGHPIVCWDEHAERCQWCAAEAESAALGEQLDAEKAYSMRLMRNLGRMIALTQGPNAHMIAKDLSLPLVEDVIGQAVKALARARKVL